MGTKTNIAIASCISSAAILTCIIFATSMVRDMNMLYDEIMNNVLEIQVLYSFVYGKN